MSDPSQPTLPTNLRQGMPQLPDIFEVEPIGFDPIYWSVVVVIVVILIVAALWLYEKYKLRTGRSKAEEEVIVSRLEELKETLRVLEPESPFSGKSQRDFYTVLTLSYRGIIDHYFSLGTSDKTLQQLRPLIRQNFTGEIQSKSLEVFERADRIKYAGFEVSLDMAKDDKLVVLNLCDLVEAKAREDQKSQRSEGVDD